MYALIHPDTMSLDALYSKAVSLEYVVRSRNLLYPNSSIYVAVDEEVVSNVSKYKEQQQELVFSEGTGE